MDIPDSLLIWAGVGPGELSTDLALHGTCICHTAT